MPNIRDKFCTYAMNHSQMAPHAHQYIQYVQYFSIDQGHAIYVINHSQIGTHTHQYIQFAKYYSRLCTITQKSFTNWSTYTLIYPIYQILPRPCTI